MDRRSLLKSAATLSAAAIVPAAVTVEAAPMVVAPIVAAPAKLSPYANYVWEWFVSHDGEVYYESFPTKEEAVEYAKRCEYSIVAECVQRDYRLSIDSSWLLERLYLENEELIGESDGIEATPAQERDLEAMVQQAIEAWVVKHRIDIKAGSFGETRNETKVEAPSPV